MLLETTLFLLLGIALYGLFINKIRGLPPGPFPLPIVGNILSLGLTASEMFTTLHKWKKQYGPVFTVYMPGPLVFMTTTETLQESLVRQGEIYAGRPPHHESKKLLLGGNYGLAFMENHVYKEQRNFAINSLRELGTASSRLEDIIVNLGLEAVEKMKEREGTPFYIENDVLYCVANVIWNLAFGRFVTYGDPVFQAVRQNFEKVLSLQTHPIMLLIDFHPKLRLLDPLFGGPVKKLLEANDKYLEIFHQEIAMVEEHYEDGTARSYTEAFLQEVKKLEREGKELGSFTRHQLTMAVYDLWSAAVATSVGSLRYSIHYLLNNPHIQVKMQAEIDEHIGSRAVRMDDQKNLHYVCAFIQELQRVAYIGPLNLPHYTLAESTVGGFHLPSGTDVMPEFQMVTSDPEVYERPAYFCPERHLNVMGKFVKDPSVTPFSLGKRICPGEGLARMEFFLFLTTFLQHLAFKSPTLIPPELKEREGFLMSPQPFDVIVQTRKH